MMRNMIFRRMLGSRSRSRSGGGCSFGCLIPLVILVLVVGGGIGLFYYQGGAFLQDILNKVNSEQLQELFNKYKPQ